MAKAPLKRAVTKCPFCKSVDLVTSVVSSIPVTSCQHCNATWHIPKGKSK